MNPETQTDITTDIEVPNLWIVKIINDDFTPMEFVISVTMNIFNKDLEEATRITMEVHEQGSSVVGIYTKDVAFTKAKRATILAEADGHPLQIIPEISA